MATSTPWGAAQDTRRVTRGVNIYQTAGHGGVHVSPTILATFPAHFRTTDTFLGPNHPGWYEEDCDWCIPVCARPDLPWPAHWFRYNRDTLFRYHPGLFAQAYPNWEGYP
jgi:hypothetical protein